MRIAVAVDWSEQSFDTVKGIAHLYQPSEVILIHAVDLHPFENPLLAPPVAKQAFEDFRNAMMDAGRKLLDQSSALISHERTKITRRLEMGRPATIILDVLKSVHPDLMIMGSRGRGVLTEVALGSVSHQVLIHADCSTLVMKRPVTTLQQVLLTIEGSDDAAYIQEWLLAHPFKQPVELSILSVVPLRHRLDAAAIPAFDLWEKGIIQGAENLVKDVSITLTDAGGYRATGRVLRGSPSDVITREAMDHDLVVVGSHGRQGLQRFLLGSVSHAVNHHATRPGLLIRKPA
jgi:Universal stress protein UspA and related nucleotide-binding proteins